MRGLIAGTLALIALSVLVQDRVATRLEEATGLSVTALRHWLSPEVAGIPHIGGVRKRLAKAI